MKFSHDVIICTKDRPLELRNVMNSLSKVKNSQKLNIIIVENSANERNKLESKEIANYYMKFSSMRILDSSPGLPTARNTGLSVSNSDIVTFFDDDVQIDENYFEELTNLVWENPHVSGFSGINSIETKTKSVKFWKYFLQIFRSNSLMMIFYPLRSQWDNNIKNEKKVFWFPGCSMSFCKGAIEFLRFNACLENGPTAGYALGEDFDFTYRLSRSGQLIQSPKLIIEHKLAPTNRANKETFEKALGMWIAYQDRTFFKNWPAFFHFSCS